MTTFSVVAAERSGDVGVIRLNDPSVLNAATLAMAEEIDRALDELLPVSRALIMTGAGRAFCAGANLKPGIADSSDDGIPDVGIGLETHFNPLMTRLRDLPVPWISLVRGAAAGIGCSMALAADMIVASDTAYFLQAFVRIGLLPDGGSSYLLSRNIGRVRAMEMMLLGDKLPASQALEWGLINQVVPDEQLESAGFALAQRLATGPTVSLGMIRQLVWKAQDAPWNTSLENERQAQRTAGRTEDFQEGIAAFAAKRPSTFRGK